MSARNTSRAPRGLTITIRRSVSPDERRAVSYQYNRDVLLTRDELASLYADLLGADIDVIVSDWQTIEEAEEAKAT